MTVAMRKVSNVLDERSNDPTHRLSGAASLTRAGRGVSYYGPRI